MASTKFWLAVVASFSVSAVVVAGCGGGAKVGESCAVSGSVDECESGGICTANGTDGAPVCLKICVAATECAATEDCNGVEGASQKACRPKAAKTGK